MIALLCSVRAEAEMILNSMTNVNTVERGSIELIQGMFAGKTVTLCIGGMGKVNAAHATTLLSDLRPEALIVFGIGGAYPASGASIGDIAVARQEIAADEGVLTADGFKDTEYIGIPLLKTSTAVIYTTYPAPKHLLGRALDSLIRYAGTVHTGTFLTLSTCTGTTPRARELEERHAGLCENMEGAAAAHVAELHNIPWLELRGISNRVEDRDLSTWNIPAAAMAAQKAVRCILEGWPH